MLRVLIYLATIFLFVSCASVAPTPTPISPRVQSELQQGKRYFEEGYYKKAMHLLLPLACGCHGNAEAQYAVGYMYYYGYGVAQDTDVGYFWIQRSANQHYPPAQKALALITQNSAHEKKPFQFEK